MPLAQEALGAIGNAMVGRKMTGTLVVFKHSGMCHGSLQCSALSHLDQFMKDSLEQ